MDKYDKVLILVLMDDALVLNIKEATTISF